MAVLARMVHLAQAAMAALLEPGYQLRRPVLAAAAALRTKLAALVVLPM
jgi:hypothetical protein